ncbi:MAG TPA: co-chaperone GroES [Armatimonadota bacterium]
MIKPIGDKVVVQAVDAPETSIGGILLPDTAKKRPQEGKVIAVGPGRVLDSGQRAQMNVKAGDVVIYAKYGGNEVTVEGEDYVILDQDQIYAVKE